MDTSMRRRPPRIHTLPSAVLQQALGFLPISRVGTLCRVCRSWRDLLSSDDYWRPIYLSRFGDKHTDKVARPLDEIGPLCTTPGGRKGRPWGRTSPTPRSFMELYKERLADPWVGDEVEVAWAGKFVMESRTTYHGQAWWSAIVIRKAPAGRYLVHYPGWTSKWDEWVMRDRLRWPPQPHCHTCSYSADPCRFMPDDRVEVRCTGTSGTKGHGAWFEAKVYRVSGSKLYVWGATLSGPMWVHQASARHRSARRRHLIGAGRGGFSLANLVQAFLPCPPMHLLPHERQ